MKLLVLLFIPLSVFAQDREQLQDAFNVLSNPQGSILQSCEATKEPAFCIKLSDKICEMKKPKDNFKKFSDEVHKHHLDKQWTYVRQGKASMVSNERDAAQREAIKDVEKRIKKDTGVGDAELEKLFTDSMKSLMDTLKGTSLPADHKEKMIKELGRVKFMTSSTFIDKRIEEVKAALPTISDESARGAALRRYSAICSEIGMKVQANYEEATGEVILCPGLIQSVGDYGGSKADILTALSYTMAHEIGHAIDSGFSDESYNDFEACQEENTSVPNYSWQAKGREISADFWGVDVYRKRIAAEGISGQYAVKNIAMASVNYCNEGGYNHPDGKSRIDEYFGRQPEIRELLGCKQPATKAACKM